MRRIVGVLVLVAALAGLTACGGSAAPMSGDAAKQLDARVTAVRAAAVAHDADGASRALDDLRQTVQRLRRDDALSDARAADILAAASNVDAQLVTITTTTTNAPPPPPTVVDNGKGNEKGKGNGKSRD